MREWSTAFTRGASMAVSSEFEAMAQACIANHETILQHGSFAMQPASRMLLYALAEEARRREQVLNAANDDES
jgi:hypothetical protein